MPEDMKGKRTKGKRKSGQRTFYYSAKVTLIIKAQVNFHHYARTHDIFFFANPPEKSTREKSSVKRTRVIYIKTGGDC